MEFVVEITNVILKRDCHSNSTRTKPNRLKIGIHTFLTVLILYPNNHLWGKKINK